MANTWQPFDSFGVPADAWDAAPGKDGVKWLHLSSRRPRGEPGDRSATWLRWAMVALGLLAATAAAVSFQAQFTMVLAAKGVQWVAALEAGIPDAAAMVFACLGIALALHGKRAVRARILNVGAVATSVTMNAIAAGPGWRDWAIWIMPPIAYALASDTLIGVVRAHAIAQQRESGEALADDDATPLAVLTGVLLWVLRFTASPRSTLSGFRTWVVEECPVAPGRRAEIAPLPAVSIWTADNFGCPDCASVVSLADGSCASCGWPRELDSADDEPELCGAYTGPTSERPWAGPCLQTKPCPLHPPVDPPMQCQVPLCPHSVPCPDHAPEANPPKRRTKTDHFLELVTVEHGPLAGIELAKVGEISRKLAPLADLDTGQARAALRPRVLAAQNGHAKK